MRLLLVLAANSMMTGTFPDFHLRLAATMMREKLCPRQRKRDVMWWSNGQVKGGFLQPPS